MKTFIIAAVTADGFIARHAEHEADWTSPEDKKLFVELTKQAGVIVMGSTTFRTIGRALSGRRTIVYTTKPDAITAEGVEMTGELPEVLVKRLESEGATGVAICGGSQVYQLFMNSGLVNELYLTVEPVVFGEGVRLFTGTLDAQLQLQEMRQLNEHTVLLHYLVKKD